MIFREPPSNYLKVHNHKTGIKGILSLVFGVHYYLLPDYYLCLDPGDVVQETIGVCVKPLHFTYNKSLELLQFIELNRLLGVSR